MDEDQPVGSNRIAVIAMIVSVCCAIFTTTLAVQDSRSMRDRAEAIRSASEREFWQAHSSGFASDGAPLGECVLPYLAPRRDIER